MRFLVILIAIIMLGGGCANSSQTVSMIEKVTLTTSDSLNIAALYRPSGGQKFAILLHMMPATKESWGPFMEKLAEAGYDSIAIDERGHGGSTQGGTLLYANFSDAEQQAKILDVEAAFEWLKGKGATEQNTVVIGASIGANLAIQFLKEHPNMPSAVALSPGLDYRGILTEPLVESLAEGQRLLLVASDEDQGSYKSIHTLKDANPEQITLKEQSNIGHGTAMFENKPELTDEVIEWLQQKL